MQIKLGMYRGFKQVKCMNMYLATSVKDMKLNHLFVVFWTMSWVSHYLPEDVSFEIISWLLSPNICKGRGEEEVLFEQCFFFALLSCQNGLLSILWSQITQVIFYERLLSFLLLPLPPPISAFLGRVH